MAIYLELSKWYGHSQPGPFFSAPTYDLSVQYFYEECVRLRQDKERLIALLHTLRWVQYFIAHICHCKYSQYTLHGAYRDYNSRKLDQLSEQVVTLTLSFAEFSKSVSSAFEDIKSHGSDTNSIFTYSKLLPCLDRTGFESIPYWNRGPWSEVRNRKTTVDTEDPVLVLFCEDENGHVVSKDELKALHNTVRAYFEFLWTKKVPPRAGAMHPWIYELTLCAKWRRSTDGYVTATGTGNPNNYL